MNSLRYAEELFRGALARVGVSTALTAHVSCDGERLCVDGRMYLLSSFRRIGLIAVGKAALSMSDAFMGIVSASLEASSKLEGVVVAGSLPVEPHAGLRYFIGGHPLPTEGSQQAAEAIFELLSGFGPDDLVVYLISGGASAMAERGLDPRLTPEYIVELYRLLLHSGLPIGQMNCVRKHLSALKGGRLAMVSSGAQQVSLLVSDVPGEDLSVIGSGPSMPDPSKVDECRIAMEMLLSRGQGSAGLRDLLQNLRIEETPKPGDATFARSFYSCVLSANDVLAAARALAEGAGFHVEIDNTCDDWECAEAATYLLQRVRDLSVRHGRVCLLSSGELSVRLPEEVGIGGRNQQFALACALQLRGCADSVTVLSAGTDGMDGNSPAAGAVVNEKTCDRALALGLDAQSYYARFDSYSFFRLVRSAVVTGATENNLRDLRILLVEPGR